MKFTKEQRKAAYKKLPEEVQNFIMYSETTEYISKKLQEIGLSGINMDIADSEILSAMIGLQSPEDALKEVSVLSGKSSDELKEFTRDIKENIFSKINELLVFGDKTSPAVPLTSSEGDEDGTNLPMIEPGESAHDVKPSLNNPPAQPINMAPTEASAQQPPIPAPTEPPEKKGAEKTGGAQKPETSPIKSHYPGGQDPYREPLV